MPLGPFRVFKLVVLLAAVGGVYWSSQRVDPNEASEGVCAPDDDCTLHNEPPLLLAQFNIHHGEGPDGVEDLARTADCLTAADIITLNEVAGSDQAQTLATLLQTANIYFPTEFQGNLGVWGNGLLAPTLPATWKITPLHHDAGHGYRATAVVTWPWRGEVLSLLLTHLDRSADRPLQLRATLAQFAALPQPKILMADLNTTADDPDLAAYLAQPDVSSTTGGANPGIDWIIVEGLQLEDSWLCDIGASDHPALLAVVSPLAGARRP